MTRPGAKIPCPGSSQPLLASSSSSSGSGSSSNSSSNSSNLSSTSAIRSSLIPNSSSGPIARLRPQPGRRRACLSAIWANQTQSNVEPNLIRRAVHSWSGYGTLVEGQETQYFPPAPLHLPTLPQLPLSSSATITSLENRRHSTTQKIPSEATVDEVAEEIDLEIPSEEIEEENEIVADSAALLEPRARRLGTALALPHLHKTNLNTTNSNSSSSSIFGMPGIKNLVTRRRDTTSPNDPLVRRDSHSLARLSSDPSGGGIGSLKTASSTSSLSSGLRKCETVLALTGLSSVLRSTTSTGGGSNTTLIPEPVQPVNRLRVSPGSLRGSASRVCSRCSSLLSLAAANGSRYSLNTAGGGFVSVTTSGSDDKDVGKGLGLGVRSGSLVQQQILLCKLCLAEVPLNDTFPIQQCSCAFCKECMKAYVEYEIAEGAYDISCPDAQCPTQGVLQIDEVERLVGLKLVEKHKKYRLNREVDLDATRTWCPRAGCETVCKLCPMEKCTPQSVHCPTCTADFCSNCKLAWHSGLTCDEYNKQLAKEGKAEEPGIPFDSDLIKCCPMCNVPIEKDEGCAQMMCKRCKHVFCWYCLTSLDDDFLLRHYDKGPCKNKLGHSRASVIWHRTQVIGIFAGFGILLLVASPLLLLAAPCIVCCKCRVCNAGPKLENEEELRDETTS